jgi:hypothetical protein
LAANENVRDAASQELSTSSTPTDRLFNGIHSSTGIQIELRAQIGILKGMHLNAPFDALIPNIIKLYQTKIAFYQELTDISTNLVSGPKSNVDYGKAIARAPKIRAALDAIDRALFQITPVVFATLIDKKPDQQTKLIRLLITRAERDKLINELTTKFGGKMQQNRQNYIVSAASVLYDYLAKKGYKCADDPP